MTNRPDVVSSSDVKPCGISDHDVSYLIRNTRAPKLKILPKTINIRNYKRFNIQEFQHDLKGRPMEHIQLVSKDVDKVWLRWKAFFLNILDKHAPVASIKVKGNSLPYVTSGLKSMIRTRDYLRAKTNKIGSTYLQQAFNHMRNKVNYLFLTCEKAIIKKKLEEHKNDLKGTWKVLKHAMGQGSKTTNVDKITEKGCQYTDNKEIADICNKHFVSIGERLAEGIQIQVIHQLPI